jgi:hypothetical protein
LTARWPPARRIGTMSIRRYGEWPNPTRPNDPPGLTFAGAGSYSKPAATFRDHALRPGSKQRRIPVRWVALRQTSHGRPARLSELPVRPWFRPDGASTLAARCARKSSRRECRRDAVYAHSNRDTDDRERVLIAWYVSPAMARCRCPTRRAWQCRIQ